MKYTQIGTLARVVHEANRVYCDALGDSSQRSWDETPCDLQESVINGIQEHLDNPELTPEQSHAAWMAFRLKHGWTHGPRKDVEAKTHPNLVPYDQLPPSQRLKDKLFKAIVDTFRDHYDELKKEATSASPKS